MNMLDLNAFDRDASSDLAAIPRRYNFAEDVLARNLAAGRVDKSAYIDPRGAWSYGQLAERVARFGNLLRGLGIHREQRILICLTDTIDWPTSFLGAIKAGEEVVCDYGSFNLEEPLDCACGSPQCRGRISPDDIENVAPKLDALVRAAFREIPNVPQPLWGLVQKIRLQIERGIAQPTHLPSLVENRWPRTVAAPARQRRASR